MGRPTTDLIKQKPELARALFPHLTEEEKTELPLSRDVNIRAVLEIDRGMVRGGMSIKEFTRLRIEDVPVLDMENPVQQDLALPEAIVFDVLMYALNKYPEISQQIVDVLGYMPVVVPPDDLQVE